jgi:hypothetical protein
VTGRKDSRALPSDARKRGRFPENLRRQERKPLAPDSLFDGGDGFFRVAAGGGAIGPLSGNFVIPKFSNHSGLIETFRSGFSAATLTGLRKIRF